MIGVSMWVGKVVGVENKQYKSRIIDTQIRRRLESIGGILITGPKWCGKSTTGMFHANSFINMDIEENRARYHLAPDAVIDGEYPRLIDEWQDVPAVWDRVRRRIDDYGKPGAYILTGSAVPGKEPSHTGTGRIARMKMRTMSLYESKDSSGKVSLRELFDSNIVPQQLSDLTYSKTVELICRGGWPSVIDLPLPAALDVSKDYIESLAVSDISRADGVERDSSKVKLLLKSLARTVTTAAKVSTLMNDVAKNADDESISDKTINSYLGALKKIFVLEEQAAWSESLRSKTRIRTSPHRHFTDPSLAVAALSATPALLEEDMETTGFLFESMCIRDLDIYTSALGGEVYFYRDEHDFEVDSIIGLDDGRWGAVEVKLGTHEFDAAADNLTKIKKRMEQVMRPPSFLMILNATSGASGTRDDGIHIVPLDLLGP
jgi:predicted AAA+ superfamily ATPase